MSPCCGNMIDIVFIIFISMMIRDDDMGEIGRRDGCGGVRGLCNGGHKRGRLLRLLHQKLLPVARGDSTPSCWQVWVLSVVLFACIGVGGVGGGNMQDR